MMIAINACLFSVILYSFAGVGWSTSTNLVPVYAWSKAVGTRSSVTRQIPIGLATLSANFQVTQYVGLQGALVELFSPNGKVSVSVNLGSSVLKLENFTFPQQTTYISFDDTDLCNTPNCPECRTVGRAVFVLVLIADIFSLFGLCFSIGRFLYNNKYLRIAGVISSFLAMTPGVTSIASWRFNCILVSKQQGSLENAKFSDFLGYNVAAGGFALCLIVFFIHLLTPHVEVVEGEGDSKLPSSPTFVEVTSFKA